MWGLGRPEDEQATYRALLSIRNSCVTVAGIQVCGRAASQDSLRLQGGVCVLCRVRSAAVTYAGGGGDAPRPVLLSLGRVACGPDRERPTKQCYHTKQVTKKLSFTDVRTIYCTHDSPDVVGMVVGPTTSGDRRGERAAALPPAVLALALHRHITQHAMSTRRPAGTPNLQRILFHTPSFSFRSHIL